MTTEPPGTDPLANRAPRLDQVGIAVGSALVAAAILMSAGWARGSGDLDWSNFLMGVAGSLGLLGVAGAAYVLVSDAAPRSNLMAWPGAFGALGTGIMVGVAMDEGDATLYVSSLVTIGLSVGGYYLTRRGAFTVSALFGLLLLYLQLFDDVIGFDDLDEDNLAMITVAVIAVFTVAVTAGGWFLPTRHLTGVVAGVIALVVTGVVHFILTVVVSIFGAVTEFDGEGERSRRDDTYDNDVWVILLISLVLCAGWAWCAWRSGHMGYRLLIAGMLILVVPLTALGLAVEHPTYWEVVAGAVGAAVLGFVGWRSVGGGENLRPRQDLRS